MKAGCVKRKGDNEYEIDQVSAKHNQLSNITIDFYDNSD